MKSRIFLPGVSEAEGLAEITETDPTIWYPELSRYGWDHFEQCRILAPHGTPQPDDKFDTNDNHKRKVTFESRLALAVLKNHTLFTPLLHKIGKCMDEFLRHARDHAARTHRAQQHNSFVEKAGEVFRDYFFTDKPYFGREAGAASVPGIEEAFRFGRRTLVGGKEIEKIMFAHMAMLNIFKQMDGSKVAGYYQNANRHYHQILRPQALFKNRGRVKRDDAALQTFEMAGYEEEPTVRSKLMPHTRAIDTFTRDLNLPSDFSYESFLREIPFVAGPSGSAAECFLSALTFTRGKLSHDELQLYALCCVGYLVGSGAHSFHEVFVIAQLLGLSYTPGCYEDAIHPLFQGTHEYQQLLQEFPDIIRDTRAPLDNITEDARNEKAAVTKSDEESEETETTEEQNTAQSKSLPTDSAFGMHGLFPGFSINTHKRKREDVKTVQPSASTSVVSEKFQRVAKCLRTDQLQCQADHMSDANSDAKFRAGNLRY
ncbi:hypothetical protein AQUSIP_13790 [Aquicella siphonis]|uniref:Uncharacterized protein n=1 Tax=Aquicella siphonis TaxID=254247 RepID=A0A5E4PHK4_9COXI|nr:hypothetical protein [Aquicella siphonis]VVC76075.1 hypothetical protein AQUSIP_13790 [Aquicella siphonis]